MKLAPGREWWEANAPTLLAAGRTTARRARAVGRAALPRVLAALRLVGRPSVLGAAYLLTFTAETAQGPLIDASERAFGADAARIDALVRAFFTHTLVALAATLALLALAIGAALGAIAGAVIRLRFRVAGKPPPSRLVLASASLALTVVIHGVALAHEMAWHPQLYSDAFYGAGGWRAGVQLLLTHRLGAPAVSWACIALVALLLPPPWRWPALARLAAMATRRARRAGLAPAACVAIAALALVAGRPSAHAAGAPAKRPNVLVLGADSFREEGLNPRVMPRLAALAEQRGVRFSHAYVPIARTLSSWTTYLTGRDPHHHGIRSMFPRWEDHDRDLDTLPGRLARAGYRTAVVSDYVGDAFNAIDLGFQQVVAPRLSAGTIIETKGLSRAWPLLPFLRNRAARRAFPAIREIRECADADMLADDAVDVLDGLREGPFFLTVFFGASHAPYAAPAPYYLRFGDRAYAGRNKYHKSRWIALDEKITPAEVAHVHGLYEGALASVDDAAGRILDELDRLGLRESTIVVVMGDHGEDLADAPGRFYGHGSHLFGDHDLQVPLVVVDPRRPGGRVEPGAVTSADLAPTLYELLGAAPPGDMDGISLVPALDGTPVAPRPTFAETELWIGVQPDVPRELRFPYPDLLDYSEIDTAHGDALVLKREMEQVTVLARHRMVRDGGWKLVYIPTAKGVVYELFDTTADPENLTDVSADHPDVKARLEGLLWDWMLRDPAMEKRHGFLAPKGVRIPEIDGQ